MTGLINRIKRITAIGLIAVLMSQSVPMTAYGEGSVTYIDENGRAQTCASYTSLSGTETTLAPGWYVVSENIVFHNSVILNGQGEYHIILADGKTMSIVGNNQSQSGVWDHYNNSDSPVGLGCLYDNGAKTDINLNIYAQSGGTGELNILNGNATPDGRPANEKVGDAINVDGLTINGGKITLETTGSGSNGITSNNLTINGGTVTVTATGTGSSAMYSATNTTINDGTSGGGVNKTGCITINGGSITSIAEGDDAFGIKTRGSITIDGGQVTAKGTNEGIYSEYNGERDAVSLSWKNESDYLSTNSFWLPNGDIGIKLGKPLKPLSTA